MKVVMADGTEIIGYTEWNDHRNVEYLLALNNPPKREESVWPSFSLEEYFREERISKIRDYIQLLPSATEEAIALGFPQNFKHWLNLKTIDITTSHQTPPDRLEVYKRIQRLPNGFNCIEKEDRIEIEYPNILRLEFVEQDVIYNTMGGLKELTAEQIGYIQNHKERFSINYSDDMSGTFLYCYDPDMTFKSFLDVAACSSFRTEFNYKKHKFPGNEPQDPEQNEENSEKPTTEEAKTIANHFKQLKSKDCAESWDDLSEEETIYLWKYHCVKFFAGYD